MRTGLRQSRPRGQSSIGASDRTRALDEEWVAAGATDQLEARHEHARMRRAFLVVSAAALVAAVAPSILPLTPGFSVANTVAAVMAAIVAATLAIGIVPLVDRLARDFPYAGRGEALVVAAALLSVGAAAIHFAVARMHFDEYTLFGVFFVGSGVAQLVWSIWVLFRRWRPLFLLAAIGNAAIVVLWAVDRIWGLPLGPTRWKPDPVGFGDSVTAAFEVLLVVGCIALFRGGRGPRVSRASVLGLAIGIVVLTTLSFLSVLGVGSSFLTPTQ